MLPGHEQTEAVVLYHRKSQTTIFGTSASIPVYRKPDTPTWPTPQDKRSLEQPVPAQVQHIEVPLLLALLLDEMMRAERGGSVGNETYFAVDIAGNIIQEEFSLERVIESSSKNFWNHELLENPSHHHQLCSEPQSVAYPAEIRRGI